MYEFPNNTDGKPVVINDVVAGFQVGDTDISAAKAPTLIFQPINTSSADKLNGSKELTHKIKISCWYMSSNTAQTQRRLLEMTRLVYEAMLNHRLVWVTFPCPICKSSIFTPQHYTIAHSAIMAPYVTDSNAHWSSIWAETKSGSAPSRSADAVAADAFLRLVTDVQNNVSVSGLSNEAKDNILYNISVDRRVIRFMYEVTLADLTIDEMAKENLRGAHFTLTAKELIRQSTYGPQNVPTGSYTLPS